MIEDTLFEQVRAYAIELANIYMDVKAIVKDENYAYSLLLIAYRKKMGSETPRLASDLSLMEDA